MCPSFFVACLKKRRAAVLAFLFSCLCLAAVTSTLYTPEQRANKTEPEFVEIDGLFVKTEDLKLGEVWEEKDFVVNLPIENRTAQPIEILGFAVSCHCLGVTPKSVVVPPRQTVTVRVLLDLTERRLSEIGRERREAIYEIQPRIANKGPARTAWRIQGLVQSAVTLDSRHLDFGESAVYGQTAVIRKVVATVHVPFKAVEGEPFG